MPPLTFEIAAPREKVREAIVSEALGAGYQLVRESDLQLVLDRPTDNVAAMVLLGSKFNRQPNARLNIVTTGTAPVRVDVSPSMVTNPGSGFEQVHDFSGNLDARQSIGRLMLKVSERVQPKGKK